MLFFKGKHSHADDDVEVDSEGYIYDLDLGIPELRHGYVSPEERKRKACWPDGPVRLWQKYLALFLIVVLLSGGVDMARPDWLTRWAEFPNWLTSQITGSDSSNPVKQSKSKGKAVTSSVLYKRAVPSAEAALRRVQAEEARKAAEAEAARQAESAAVVEAGQTVAQAPAPAPTPAPVPSGPVNHVVARSCVSPDNGTAACQWAVDAGGLVVIHTHRFHPASTPEGPNNPAVDWIIGHNTSESWILDVHAGDEVMVNGVRYRAAETWDVGMNEQLYGDGPWFHYTTFLQTCLFDGGHMRQVGLIPA